MTERADVSRACRRRETETRGDGGESTLVTLAPDERSDWTVHPGVLGKFTEMNGREAYPGIYSEHLVNGSFEEWYTWPKRTPDGNPPWWRRSEVLYRDVDSYQGLAFPWEPVIEGRATFEHPVGGVHGRRADLERTDVHGRAYREPPPRYQRITIWTGRAGVEQRLALPDRRTLAYDLTFSVRGGGNCDRCDVALRSPDGNGARETVPITDEWQRYERRLELPAESDGRYDAPAFGQFHLSFEARGRGHVDLDWAMLAAGDAVAGTFNPTTVENVREYGIPSIRWPGGNFASQYRWRDGIGPIEERPVRAELHWGGLEPNYLGVNEFLEFCEHADVEPYLNLGFSEGITPTEAAGWVEYVNGSTDTEFGALRAEHGYDEPWGVEAWQVGNEVWGTFQIGHTDAADYGNRFPDYHEAMTAVDPDVTVLAAGLDPGDHHWGGPSWNEALLEAAAGTVDGLDVHRYVHGESGDWDPVAFNQELVLFPTQFEDRLRETREQAEGAGVDDPVITVGEWNLGAGGLNGGPRANYGTMAHGAFCAGMYNAFVRQGRAVRYGHQRDNAFKHRPYPADCRPVRTPNNAVLALYSEPLVGDERAWHHVPTSVDGTTGDIDRHCKDGTDPDTETIAPMSGVPFVDAAALAAADGDTYVVFLVNRDLSTTHRPTVELPVANGASIEFVALTAGDPLADRTDWDGTTSHEREERTLNADGRDVTVVLPPAAVARLRFEAEE